MELDEIVEIVYPTSIKLLTVVDLIEEIFDDNAIQVNSFGLDVVFELLEGTTQEFVS